MKFGFSLLLFIFVAAFAYVIFCFDKTIIIFGSICYIINTLQIIALILPSYLYFFQTLLCIKCKDIQYVLDYIEFLEDLFDAFPAESNSDSNDKNSEKPTKKNLMQKN